MLSICLIDLVVLFFGNLFLLSHLPVSRKKWLVTTPSFNCPLLDFSLILTFRLLAWLTQWVLQRYWGVLVKIGSVGLFSCKKVQIVIKKGLSVVGFAMQWLSGILFCHETYCKPTFISMREIFARFARSSSLWIFLATN